MFEFTVAQKFFWEINLQYEGTHKSRYNNGLIAKLVNNFDDVEERREEREERLAPS